MITLEINESVVVVKLHTDGDLENGVVETLTGTVLTEAAEDWVESNIEFCGLSKLLGLEEVKRMLIDAVVESLRAPVSSALGEIDLPAEIAEEFRAGLILGGE